MTLFQLWYALKIASRSFRGHIRELLAKEHWSVDLGPLLRRSESGHLTRDSRTQSRTMGIEALVRARPWTNVVDLEIFLQGFDWGEQYAKERL